MSRSEDEGGDLRSRARCYDYDHAINHTAPINSNCSNPLIPLLIFPNQVTGSIGSVRAHV
jgi:hypothetical protein